MWNGMSGGVDDVVPPRGNGGMLAELIRNEGSRVPLIALRGRMTYHMSRQIFRKVGMASKFIGPAAIALTVLDLVPDVIDLWQRNERKFRRIPQNSLVERVPGEEGSSVICEEGVCRRSSFTFRHSDEQYTITGIACVPVSQEIQSPEAEVIEGGLNKSHVAIRLTPEEEGQYGCRIIIFGKIRQPPRQQSRSSGNKFLPPSASGVPAGSSPTSGVPAASSPTSGVPAGSSPTSGVPAVAVDPRFINFAVLLFILFLLVQLLQSVVTLFKS